MVVIDENEYLAHYGILRKSGRYPWGSGGSHEHEDVNAGYLSYLSDMRKQGMSDTEIAKSVGISTTQLRAAKTIALAEKKQSDIAMAQRLRDKGTSNVEGAKRMGIPESSFRALLVPGADLKAKMLTGTADMLQRQVDEKKFLDVGTGVENYLGVSKEKLGSALAILEEKGYSVHTVNSPQVGTNFDTKYKVLVPPGVTQRDLFLNKDKIKQIQEYSEDGGENFTDVKPPLPIKLDRVGVRYGPDGGAEADGVIYVRPGVADTSLGKSRYAQVRVQVGDGHYLKGMAMYKDDLPDGVDLVFNTNKEDTGNKLDAMKKLSDDPELPFNSIVRQITDENKNPTSVMNIVNEEGEWAKWSKNISSQALSKQKPSVVREQLGLTYDSRKGEFDEINSLTNPTVKKKLLEDFADSADSAAVHLKAARLPGQNWHVILPLDKIKEGEIYAPNYDDGKRVALIRFPHGGTFEIPELVVNNKNPQGRSAIGPQSRDAIGIHPSVAARMSGADFDGDTVLVIPNDHGKIISSPALERLKKFDPRVAYPGYEGMPKLSPGRKQQLMGDVSNLITDMTLKGASHSELVPAIMHSMVVIDAEKHNLNYKQSEIDNGIRALKQKYQGSSRGGASTLISRKKSKFQVNERKAQLPRNGGPVDPVTGRRVFEPTNRQRRGRDGELIPVKQWVNKLAETTDAHTLVSDKNTPIERLYADHSNRLKELANKSRLAAINTPPLRRSASAARTYAHEVASLSAKLALAQSNAPRERQAQVIANAKVKAKRESNPDLDNDTLKKIKYQALKHARDVTGAKKDRIEITQEEWNAIQHGAVSNDKLDKILRHADMDRVRELATPKRITKMTSNKVANAKDKLALGYTRAEVARQLGVSLSTLDAAINEGSD